MTSFLWLQNSMDKAVSENKCQLFDGPLNPLHFVWLTRYVYFSQISQRLIAVIKAVPTTWQQVKYHYIFIISELWLTSHSRSTVVLLNTGTPGTSRRNLQWGGCQRWDSKSQPLGYKPSALAIEQNSSKAIVGKESSSCPIIGILTVNFSTGTRSSCVQ